MVESVRKLALVLIWSTCAAAFPAAVEAAQVDILGCIEQNVAFRVHEGGHTTDWKMIEPGETTHFRCVGPCHFRIRRHCTNDGVGSCDPYSQGDLRGKYSSGDYLLVELDKAQDGDYKEGAIIRGDSCPAKTAEAAASPGAAATPVATPAEHGLPTG